MAKLSLIKEMESFMFKEIGTPLLAENKVVNLKNYIIQGEIYAEELF